MGETIRRIRNSDKIESGQVKIGLRLDRGALLSQTQKNVETLSTTFEAKKHFPTFSGQIIQDN